MMTKNPLLMPALSLVVGILAGGYMPDGWPVWPMLAAVVLLTLAAYRLPVVQSVGIGLCFVVLGTLLYVDHRRRLSVSWPDGEVTGEAVIVSEVTEKPKTVGMDIILVGSNRRLKCYIAKDSRSRALTIGCGLRFKAHIEPNRDFRVGTFDYRRYLEVHGFTGNVYISSHRWQNYPTSLTGLSLLERTRLYFLKLRHRLLKRYVEAGVGDKQLAIVSAMALGDKSALSREQRELYSQSGASHVLALSGLHLGVIYALLSLFTVGRRFFLVTQLLTLLSIWAYVFLVGLSPSVVRAAIMISVYALLALGGRSRMSINTLAFTAIVMLCWNPYTLYDVGFQLSFLAVLSILMWMPFFESPILRRWFFGHRLLHWLWGLLAVSVATQTGVAPLIAYYFGRFPTCFLLTNLVAIPATIVILYLALATLIVPWLGGWLSTCVDWLNTALTVIIGLPGSSIEGLHPSSLQVMMTYVVILAIYGIVCRLRPHSSPL